MKSKLLLSAAAVTGLIAAGAAAPANAAETHASADTMQDAHSQIVKSAKAVRTMEGKPELKALLAKAHGIFIVPNFTRAAFMVGGRGGEGVLMIHNADGSWTNPSFYNIGGISVGPQAGGSHGYMAFLLMTNNAVKQFEGRNNFSLNAGAGLTIVNYSANSQASWGKGDIIVWSNTAGAYAGATISGTDINWDEDETRAFYGKPTLTQQALFHMKMENRAAMQLEQALPNT